MTDKFMIDIGKDFSPFPGPRHRRHGRFSGEEFRQEFLVERLRSALAAGEPLVVVLDTVALAYLNSFLEEAFGGLVRDEGFSAETVLRTIEFRVTKPRFNKYKLMAERAIKEEGQRSPTMQPAPRQLAV
ncbi:DUF4325 domain-containing protein [Aurantimonas manganoxydans]|uniref:DUF4325 domain-containing protein n=1 Tax=Aurantimonas manganoxydans TaxID=651183 RepID=UPI0003240C14|nr:DUF4325 domain-containing protein [Aurantimonas manganoxydans]